MLFYSALGDLMLGDAGSFDFEQRQTPRQLSDSQGGGGYLSIEHKLNCAPTSSTTISPNHVPKENIWVWVCFTLDASLTLSVSEYPHEP